MKRLLSLDFFRGITIIAMIIVNSPGSWSYVYNPLRHAEWHGATPTDLIFPFFLFIVGVSISLSFVKIKNNFNKIIYLKIIRRSVIIFALGIFLSLFPDFDFYNLRFVGVLQRIALVYLICSILYLNFNLVFLVITSFLILIFYWILMMFVPFGGFDAGTIEPGINFAAWVDSFIVPGRLYMTTWDPEGFFSTIPAIVTCISGIITGEIIKYNSNKIINLILLGFLLLIIGLVWDIFFPINKHIWTSSYVMFSSGIAMVILAISIFIIDYKSYDFELKFSIAFGSNAITAYVLHGVLWKLFQIKLIDNMGIQELWMDIGIKFGLYTKLTSLTWAIFYTLFIYIIIYQLYKRKIFLKV
tara:strand:- start:5034 stop:6104 length:1071 start_codon:yes stop_codon:yes gene_type:complete